MYPGVNAWAAEKDSPQCLSLPYLCRPIGAPPTKQVVQGIAAGDIIVVFNYCTAGILQNLASTYSSYGIRKAIRPSRPKWSTGISCRCKLKRPSP